MTEGRKVLELMGAPGSPYTRKMLAVLRFSKRQWLGVPG